MEYMFGDSIATVHDRGNGVDVTVEHGRPCSLELLVGADGLPSITRRLVFGPPHGGTSTGASGAATCRSVPRVRGSLAGGTL